MDVIIEKSYQLFSWEFNGPVFYSYICMKYEVIKTFLLFG